MLEEEALAKNVKAIIPKMTGPTKGVDEHWNQVTARYSYFRIASSPGFYGIVSSCERCMDLLMNSDSPTTYSTLIFIWWKSKGSLRMVLGGHLSASRGMLTCPWLKWAPEPQKLKHSCGGLGVLWGSHHLLASGPSPHSSAAGNTSWTTQRQLQAHPGGVWTPGTSPDPRVMPVHHVHLRWRSKDPGVGLLHAAISLWNPFPGNLRWNCRLHFLLFWKFIYCGKGTSMISTLLRKFSVQHILLITGTTYGASLGLFLSLNWDFMPVD